MSRAARIWALVAAVVVLAGAAAGIWLATRPNTFPSPSTTYHFWSTAPDFAIYEFI
jgi:hypothetical protein